MTANIGGRHAQHFQNPIRIRHSHPPRRLRKPRKRKPLPPLPPNLISTIVCQEDANKLLHDKFREKITEIAKIERIPSSLGGSKFLYSPTYDMIAYYE